MQFLSEGVLDFIRGLPQGIPRHDPNFPEVVSSAYKELEKYYQHMYIQIRDIYPEVKDDGSHYEEFRQTILFNASGYINFAIFATAYKVKNLLDDVVYGLNENKSLQVAMSSRAIIEYCVTFRDFKRNIDSIIQNMSAQSRIIDSAEPLSEEFNQAVANYDKAVFDIVNIGADFSRATRFNWSSLFDADSTAFDSAWDDLSQQKSQKNVMTLLERYPEVKTKKLDNELLKYYALLCEYTHPNIGSHHLITERVTRVHETTIMYTFKPTPESNIPLIHSVRAITVPLSVCLPNLFDELAHCRNIEQFFLYQFHQTLGVDFQEEVN